MRTRVPAMLASALLTSSLMLAACSAPAGNTSAAGSTSAEATAQSVEATPTDPAQLFVGEWKLAKAETNGLQMYGDFASVLGTKDGAVLNLKEDGSGKMSYGEEGGEVTWKLTGDTAIEVTPKEESGEESTTTTLPVTYDKDNKALTMEMKDDTTSVIFTFTADGTIAGMPNISLSGAKAITSLDQIKGDWKICGAGIGGAIMIGDANELAAMGISGLDTALSIKDDGTLASDSSSKGEKITINEQGASVVSQIGTVSLKLSDNYLLMDLSEILGQSEEIYAIFSK